MAQTLLRQTGLGSPGGTGKPHPPPSLPHLSLPSTIIPTDWSPRYVIAGDFLAPAAVYRSSVLTGSLQAGVNSILTGSFLCRIATVSPQPLVR
jgi:hypothetical protein